MHDLAMPRLMLIPGLGANRLLFEAQRHHFDQDLFLPDWIAPMSVMVNGKAKPEPLREYAHRWAERWKETVLSKPETRAAYWIGGVSFGGQIALEAAGYLADEGMPPKGVFLISANRTSDSIGFMFRAKAAAGSILGAKTVAALLHRVADQFVKKEGLSALDARLLKRIAEGANIEHLLWGAKAAATWTYTEKDVQALVSKGVRIHQIHGEKDWVIPLRRGHPDRVIAGGGHLINITHADEVNAYLEDKMG